MEILISFVKYAIMKIICVKPMSAKEVMRLLNCSKTTAYRKLTKLKNEKGKKRYAIISLNEFCEFYGIDIKG